MVGGRAAIIGGGGAAIAPPVTSRSNRERAHVVPLARRLAGKSGASPEGRAEQDGPGTPARQLNVPCSTTIGEDEGDIIMAPLSPQPEPQDGPHAGSHAGAQDGPHAGPHGAGVIKPPPEQGERNSMKEGRRQLLALPKQLLHPGAAARLPRAITRQRARHMIGVSSHRGGHRGRT